ncbi:ABC transporter substrate-binding protein [Chloroflexota bacterium]
MQSRKITQVIMFLFILFSILLSACAQVVETEAPPKEPAAEEAVGEEPAAEELTKIRLATLPVMELTPVFLAQQEGFFAKHGVEVETIPTASGQEKDQLLAVGEADCGQGEHLSTLLFNQEKTQVQQVTGSYRPSETHPIFSIIAAANSGIESLEDLKGVEIGTSEATINEYVATGILQKNGFSDEDIKFIGVPRIPDRLALIASGELKSASLPSHLGLMATQQGAKLIADDGKYPELIEATWICRIDFIDENPEAIKGYVSGIAEAVQMINADPQKYKNIAIENNLIPKPIAETYVMPTFPPPYVPSVEGFEAVYKWALEKGIITNENISYEESVRPEFVP